MGDSSETPEDGPGGASAEDRELLALLREGRRDEAFGRLSTRLAFVRTYLAARYAVELGGPDGVDELVHEAASKVLECIDDYQPARGGLAFWAWAIAMNLCTDRLRSERARRAREREVARAEATIDDRVERDVREAIARLDEPYRTVLSLDLDHGGRAPMHVLVGVLGAAPQTIYNWRTEARRALRGILS